MTTSLASCIGLKSPAVSKFREPYGLCCTSAQSQKISNGPINHINYNTNGHFSSSCNNNNTLE